MLRLKNPHVDNSCHFGDNSAQIVDNSSHFGDNSVHFGDNSVRQVNWQKSKIAQLSTIQASYPQVIPKPKPQLWITFRSTD